MNNTQTKSMNYHTECIGQCQKVTEHTLFFVETNLTESVGYCTVCGHCDDHVAYTTIYALWSDLQSHCNAVAYRRTLATTQSYL